MRCSSDWLKCPLCVYVGGGSMKRNWTPVVLRGIWLCEETFFWKDSLIYSPEFFLYLNFFLIYWFERERERKGERERETSICCPTHLCTHWLILVCALTRMDPATWAYWDDTNQLSSYLARALVQSFVGEKMFSSFWQWFFLVLSFHSDFSLP